MTKICSKCEKVLPLTEFYKHKLNKDGLQYMCKKCRHIIKIKDREKKGKTDSVHDGRIPINQDLYELRYKVLQNEADIIRRELGMNPVKIVPNKAPKIATFVEVE